MIGGSTSTLGIMYAIHDAMIAVDSNLMRKETSKTVPSYERLIAGEADLNIVPKASESVMKLTEAE